MYSEKEDPRIYYAGKDDLRDTPYMVNLHDGSSSKNPYQWIRENGSKMFEIPEIKFFFWAKHENSGKIESHLWFYKGFCATTNPQYCQMLDAGTIPLARSVSKIIKYLDKYSNVGGAWGEIATFQPSERELGFGWNLIDDPDIIEDLKEKTNDVLNKRVEVGEIHQIDEETWVEKSERSCFSKFEARCMVLAQYVEYKISHYLDKSFESLFGFVSVLPGAFCTFRWKAINGDPLKSFFKGLEKDKHTAKEANMYLAEDRVMCLEILRKYSEWWVLRYIPGWIALTDPPDSVIGLIKQRRRWTNGSLFASWYVLDHINMIGRSGHTTCRKISLFCLYIYMMLNFIFSILLVGSLYASFTIFIKAFFEDDDCDQISYAKGFTYGYLCLLFVFVLMALTKPISKSGKIYTWYVVIFGIFIFISIGFGFSYFWDEDTNIYVAILLTATLIGSYIIPPILNINRMNLWKYFIGVIIMIFLSPTYINIIIIYSMANLHDVSWGNRETDVKNAEETRKSLEQFRALYLIVWAALNIAYGYGIIYLTSDGESIYILVLTILISGNVLLKLAAAILYFMYEKYTKCCIWLSTKSFKNSSPPVPEEFKDDHSSMRMKNQEESKSFSKDEEDDE